MGSYKLWTAKRTFDRIVKYGKFIAKMKVYIVRDRKSLRKEIKNLSNLDFLEFQRYIGLVGQADYDIIKHDMELRECQKKKQQRK